MQIAAVVCVQDMLGEVSRVVNHSDQCVGSFACISVQYLLFLSAAGHWFVLAFGERRLLVVDPLGSSGALRLAGLEKELEADGAQKVFPWWCEVCLCVQWFGCCVGNLPLVLVGLFALFCDRLEPSCDLDAVAAVAR